MNANVIIVGGGPAGIITALTAKSDTLIYRFA